MHTRRVTEVGVSPESVTDKGGIVAALATARSRGYDDG